MILTGVLDFITIVNLQPLCEVQDVEYNEARNSQNAADAAHHKSYISVF